MYFRIIIKCNAMDKIVPNISNKYAYSLDFSVVKELLCSRQWLACNYEGFAELLTFYPNNKMEISRNGIVSKSAWTFEGYSKRIRLRGLRVAIYLYPFYWDGSLLVFSNKEIDRFIFLYDATKPRIFPKEALEDFDAYSKKAAMAEPSVIEGLNWPTAGLPQKEKSSPSEAVVLEDPLKELWDWIELTWKAKENIVRKEEKEKEKAEREEERARFSKIRKEYKAEAAAKENALKKELSDTRLRLKLMQETVELHQTMQLKRAEEPLRVESYPAKESSQGENADNPPTFFVDAVEYDQKVKTMVEEYLSRKTNGELVLLNRAIDRVEKLERSVKQMEEQGQSVKNSPAENAKVKSNIAAQLKRVWDAYHNEEEKKKTLKQELKSKLSKDNMYMDNKKLFIISFIALLVSASCAAVTFMFQVSLREFWDPLFMGFVFACGLCGTGAVLYMIILSIDMFLTKRRIRAKLKEEYISNYFGKLLDIMT